MDDKRARVTSPFYPAYYPNSHDCQWDFNPVYARYYAERFNLRQIGRIVRLKFTYIDLAQGDSVFLESQGKKYHFNNDVDANFTNIKRFLNKWLSLCVSVCTLNFKSDDQYTARGFSMENEFKYNIDGKLNSLL